MAASDASIARSIARDRSEEVNYLGKAVNEIQRRLTLAGTKGASLLTPGTRVRYYGIHGEGWTGIVCPRPSNLRQHGNTGERLVYVVSDNGRVYGCYPGNLVRL